MGREALLNVGNFGLFSDHFLTVRKCCYKTKIVINFIHLEKNFCVVFPNQFLNNISHFCGKVIHSNNFEIFFSLRLCHRVGGKLRKVAAERRIKGKGFFYSQPIKIAEEHSYVEELFPEGGGSLHFRLYGSVRPHY